MNGIKSDVVYSANKSIICDSCVQRLTTERVATNTINKVKVEIKEIKKGMYYRFTDLIKKYSIWTLVLSTISALLIGIFGSLLTTIIWGKLLK